MPIWAYMSVIVAVVLAGYVAYTVINSNGTRTSAPDISKVAAASGPSEPLNTFAPNAAGPNSCTREYGTSGQFGYGISSWRPRADGRCYLDDQPSHPEPHLAAITNGALTVNAASYSYYMFTVPENARFRPDSCRKSEGVFS